MTTVAMNIETKQKKPRAPRKKAIEAKSILEKPQDELKQETKEKTETKELKQEKTKEHLAENLTENLTEHLTEDFVDPYIETPWNIIESYFKAQHLERLVRHQLESYNNFVSYQIVKTIDMFNPVHIASEQDFDPKSGKHSLELFITFENFNIYRPQIFENNGAIKLMFPQEARLRNFTYASAMTVDINIKYIVRNGENLQNIQTFYKVLPKIHIGKLPIMMKSNICVLNQYKHVENIHTGECRFDAGGYFIINGSEKTVLGQERAAENKVQCFNISKNNTKYTWLAEIKSVPDFKCISPKQINMMVSSKNNGFGYPLLIQIPRIKQPIPLFVVFRAVGVLADKDICEKILLDLADKDHKEMLDFLKASIIDANKYLTQQDAIRHIMSYAIYTPINMDKETGAKKKYEFTLDILKNDLFPHCQSPEQKIYFLGFMANRLLQASFEWNKADDRDSYLNKRVDSTGVLLNNLFRNYFNKLVKDMEKQIIREINGGSWKSTDNYENIVNLTNIYKIIKSTTIENGLKRALATGDFGIKHTNSNKVGVAQVLNRLTYVSSLSHARRISTPTDKSGKLIPPRKLHNTSWGFLCLTGDIDVLLANRIDTKKLKDIRDGDWVNTVNRTTLMDEPSDMYQFFSRMPDKLYELTTISGRKIKATADHPFLIKTAEGKYEMKKVGELAVGDKVIVRPPLEKVEPNDTQNMDTFEEKRKKMAPMTEFKKMEEFYKIQGLQTDIVYEDFVKDNIVDNGCISVPILSIVEIEPELVYDFTTRSDNHSFVASSIVSSNCPAETPEGQSVGVVKNLSYMTHLTIHSNSLPLYDYVLPHIQKIELFQSTNPEQATPSLNLCTFKTPTYGGVLSDNGNSFCYGLHALEKCEGVKPEQLFGKVKVFINGAWVGITDQPYELYMALKEKKYKGIINVYTSIVFDYKTKEIRVCNDSGRLMRPLLRVKDGKLLLTESVVRQLRNQEITWDELFLDTELSPAVLEYIDPEEQSWSLVAMHPRDLIKSREDQDKIYKYTHCEIHPSTMFGILASCIPFPEHNQSPRNTYQCLDMYEKVLMADGTRKDICDVEVGDEVICFDPETMATSVTRVTHQYVRKTNKRIFKIKTVTSRVIVATEDHKFMTQQGWCEVQDMVEGYDKIGIHANIADELRLLRSMPESHQKDTIVQRGEAIFVPIYSIEEIDNSKGTYLVSDITVESENHSFIAGNDFLSSNCAQGKQAMGVYVTNYENRMDKTAYVLNYPTRPLVDTRVMNLIQLNKIPSGTNVIVAIMTHTGYNQEDSLLFNKGSLDRGLFVATIYHTEKDEDKQKINGDEEIRCKPDPTKTKGIKFGNYNKVNSKGVIPENTLVENRDIIIAKVTPIKENRNDHTKLIKYEDQSKIFRTTEETYIDKNYIDRNGDGYNFAKVRLRTVRKPVIGDKFSSRMGQKGTIGNIIPEEDMPFTKMGVKPDLIINPHAIPSRMTIGQLKETVLGKTLLELGLFGDGTSFGEFDVKDICKELQKVGYESNGNEILYNGLTGEQVECSVFMGPVFYQRLKHMVNDKSHSRSIGPMVNLTRQPAEGRSRDGGLRFGEMERDCMVSHGAARFTRGRMYDASDKYQVHVCKKCGLIAAYNDALHIHHCRTCDNRTDFSYVEIPYACKLLFQELITMNVVPRIMTE